MPKNSGTILQTKPINILNFHNVEPETYHFGLTSATIHSMLQQNISTNLENTSVIQIVAGIDGLPLFKSTSEKCWPILTYIRPNRSEGFTQPQDNNKFLKFFYRRSVK